MFKVWIIALICFSVFGCLSKTILPDGKTTKITAFVFSVVLLICSINPVLSLFSESQNVDITYLSDSDLNDRTEDFQVEFAERYCLSAIKRELSMHKITLQDAVVELKNVDGKYKLKTIKIKRADLAYYGDEKNINITSITKDVVAEFAKLSSEDVVIYE